MRRTILTLALLVASCGGTRPLHQFDAATAPAPDTQPADSSEASHDLAVVAPDTVSPPRGTAQTGESCQKDADCSAPNTICLLKEPIGWGGFHNGYCTLPCSLGTPCGQRGFCIQLAGYGPRCAQTCTLDPDTGAQKGCRFWEGYSCVPSEYPGQAVCLAPGY